MKEKNTSLNLSANDMMLNDTTNKQHSKLCMLGGFELFSNSLLMFAEYLREEAITLLEKKYNKELVSYRKFMCFFNVLFHHKLWFRLKACLILF